jgi:hypothetical protein
MTTCWQYCQNVVITKIDLSISGRFGFSKKLEKPIPKVFWYSFNREFYHKKCNTFFHNGLHHLKYGVLPLFSTHCHEMGVM